MALNIGDKVRVVSDAVMYHLPGFRKDPRSVNGLTGVIVNDKSTQDGVEVTATCPYIVELDGFDGKGKAHFAETELEVIADSENE